MKLVCSECYGSGIIDMEYSKSEHELLVNVEFVECKNCNGDGYTEDSSMDYYIEIGKATESWFKYNHMIESDKNEIWVLSDLLDWYRKEVE